MATEKEIEQVERRAELALKIAILEERSLHNQEHLTKIENVLVKHATDEEDMLKEINVTVRDFKLDVDKTIDTKIEPIQKDVNDLKFYARVLAAVGSVLAFLITVFKDFLIDHFIK